MDIYLLEVADADGLRLSVIQLTLRGGLPGRRLVLLGGRKRDDESLGARALPLELGHRRLASALPIRFLL